MTTPTAHQIKVGKFFAVLTQYGGALSRNIVAGLRGRAPTREDVLALNEALKQYGWKDY